MTKISEALTAYRICAQADGRSLRTIEWITSSMRYFSDFLSVDRDISSINANDLRSFIIYLQKRKKYLKHPYNHAQDDRISPQSIETYNIHTKYTEEQACPPLLVLNYRGRLSCTE